MEHHQAIALAQHYVSLSLGEHALRALQNASPEVAESWLWRANALQRLHRHEEALEATRSGLAIDPENPYLHHAQAQALMMLRRFVSAEAAIVASLRLSPEEPEAIATHAVILDHLGKRKEARKAILRASKLGPEVRAVRALRAILTRPMDIEDALEVSQELLAAEPDGALEHWWHARNLAQWGRLRQAEHHFARAAALEPTNAPFTRASLVSRHWFFRPLVMMSPVMFWLPSQSIVPLLLFAAMHGGILWRLLWLAVGWTAYVFSYLFALRFAERTAPRQRDRHGAD
ncbi:MAG: hypothetical protein JOZ54_07910 [Acidobacteria bacterium]|nr:hypothetical protein [Acidobacteriota bacterium]